MSRRALTEVLLGSAGARRAPAGSERQRRMRYLLALLICLVQWNACGAEPGLEKTPVDGIKNFSRLVQSDSLLGSPVGFGGATRPEAMPWLRGQGFVTVINVRLESEEGVDIAASRAAAKASGLEYVQLPLSSESPAADFLDRFNSIAANPTNHPVYLHCSSATRVAAVWMASQVRSSGRSLAEVSTVGSDIAERPADAMRLARLLLDVDSGG